MGFMRSVRRGPLLLPALALGLLAFAPGTASAQLIDPATLHIGGVVPPHAGDPNQLGGSGLVTVSQTQASTDALKEPWLLILGIPNAGSNFFNGVNPITSVSYSNPAPGSSGTGSGTLGGLSPLYGGSWNSTTGYAGSMVSGGEAYSTIQGLQGPYDKSNSFVNWSGADKAINGITSTSFGIYVFEINAELDGQGIVSIQFNPKLLPTGVFVIAYGQTSTHLFDTPFTESGLTTGGGGGGPPAVPAPPTLALALSGLVGAGFVGLRRLRRPQAATV